MKNMKNLKNTILVGALLLASTSASAAIFNFADIADTDGEFGASSMSFSDNGVNLTATGFVDDGTAAFAYLDRGNAGLGVCQTLTSTDQCSPSSDDNVTYTETLRLTFEHEVSLDSIVFVNGDHQTDFNGDFVLTIDGISNTYGLTNNFGTGLDLFGTVFDFYNPNTGGGSNVSNNQQFYINTLTTGTRSQTPPAVPIPAAVWLFGSGLLGLVAVARRRS